MKLSPTALMILGLVKECEMRLPVTPVAQTELARAAGISKQRVGQHLIGMSEKGIELPPIATRKSQVKRMFFEREVRDLIERGLGKKEIAEQTERHINTVRRAYRQLIQRGEIPEPERRDYTQLDERIVFFRNVLGLGDKAIAGETGEKVGTVTWRLSKLIPEGKAVRLRKKRRTEEEVQEFDTAVKLSREEGLINKQIAKRLSETEANIRVAVLRLLGRKEIEPRWGRIPEGQKAKIIELIKRGLTYKETAQELHLSKGRVGRVIREVKQKGIL